MTYRTAIQTITLSLTGAQAWASTAATPWATQANTFYLGINSSYIPIAMALITIGIVIAYWRHPEQEGLLNKLLVAGMCVSIAATALSWVVFWGATPTAAGTLVP
jgi:hypothetical protein